MRFSRRFKKMYQKKPTSMQYKIDECLRLLSVNPRARMLRTHKMKGYKNPFVWECYIDNDGNRITFEWNGDLITLRNNCNHDMLYRNP